MSKILPVLTFSIIFLFVQNPTFASKEVVINELLADPPSGQGEWVELYFPSGGLDISSYYLVDSANNKKLLNVLENCGSYSVYNLVTSSGNPTDSWLNNSGQESLFLYDQNSNLIDAFENWSNPGENKTLGRIPDGSSNWKETQTPTKCQQNSQAQPSPSPTPSPSPSPTLSPSLQSPTPSPKISPSPKAINTSIIANQILGEKQLFSPSPSPKPSPSPSPQAEQESQPKTKIAAIFTGSGAILIGLSIGFLLWYKKVLGNTQNSKEEKIDN